MTDHSSREGQFNSEMLAIYDRAKAETGYVATRFRQMVLQKGGLATARDLLNGNKNDVSEGFVQLALRQRLDLTVEALALRDEWANLFTEQELANARHRLRAT
jgi:hypothetical protein